jgi:hypothetical protein
MALLCPFPAARNPATTWAERHTLAWAAGWGLLTSPEAYERFAEARFAELMGRAYPTADPALLATIADWNSWTFLVDTQLDHHALGRDPDSLRQFALAVELILGDIPCPIDPAWTPLLHALADVVTRFRRSATPSWLRRFRRHVGLTLAACVREAMHRQQGVLVSEETYREMRPHTSGVMCFFDLIELSNHAPLDNTARAHSAITNLVSQAVEVIYLANDLASAEKERQQGDQNNLVLIVERARSVSPQAALRYVEQRHNEIVTAFLAEAAQLARAEQMLQRSLASYVRGLGTCMRANHDWSQLSGRYRVVPPRAAAVNSDLAASRP